jgi:type IV pilus assembly protein PilA
MKNQKGFSLIELLVVVIIIAIVAAIAIPNLLASRRAANEASAISSLRTIHSAQSVYFSTTGNNAAYSGALTGAGSLATAGLIDATLASGTKSGYDFAMSVSAAPNAGATYCASAQADVQDSTGTRSFAVGSNGVIVSFPAAGGAAACAAGVVTGGTAIQ